MRKMKKKEIKIVALALASFLMLVFCIIAASPDSTLRFIDPTPADNTHQTAMNLNNDTVIGENSTYAKDDVVTYTQEQEFPWGLVPLNIRKSIYKPGETAEFIIVVLDKDGHSVCDADISMTVINPNNEKTVYRTDDGTILPGEECGLYNAEYLTEVEGKHAITVNALIGGAEVSFNTYFSVQQDYEFDIIRTAQSKIDPTRQDRFDVEIDIESFTDADSDSVTIKEFVPASFNVFSTDADTVLLEDDTKTITWNKDLIAGKTSVSYSYSVPHIWPYLYALGPVEIDHNEKTFTEARAWYVAVDPSVGYTEKSSDTTWLATTVDDWEVKDLSGYGVPANAVCEVVITNLNGVNEYYGGVRANGSLLDRKFLLHKAEAGGVDMVTMFVQANDSSMIEHYSDYLARVEFILVGYWSSGTYVEKMESFTANATWPEINLSGYNVSANQICEIVMVNKNADLEKVAGVRTNGSSLQRKVDIHEAEGGGVDAVTMLVTTNADSKIDAYAETDVDIDFYLVGYWTTAPGPYTEKFGDIEKPTGDAAWKEKNLSEYGVPAEAVAEIILANAEVGTENEQGVREVGSTLVRKFDIHEAEAGGRDMVRVHVAANASSWIEFYHEDVSDAYNFTLVGYWSNTTKPNVTDLIPAPNSPFNASDGMEIEIGANVTDDISVDTVLANVTYPNSTIQQIELSKSVGDKYNYSFTIPYLKGTYNVTFIANDGWNNVNDTETTNFTLVDDTPPRVVLIHPWGSSCAGHYHDENKDVDITVDVTDLTGVDTILANITFPNQTLSINLSGFDYGLQSDDFSTNTTGVNWSHANTTLVADQSCYTDINETYPGKMFIALDGGTGPGMHCAYNSIKRANGNYDLNLTFDVTHMDDDTFFTLRSAPTDSMSASGLRVYISYIHEGGKKKYRLAYYNGTATCKQDIPNIKDDYGKFRIKRSNMTGTPVFNLYYWDNSGSAWVESSHGNISLPGSLRTHFIQIKPGSSASNYGALNVTIDDFHISGDNYKFAIFNQTNDNGTYNVTIIANDTTSSHYVNATVKSNFTIDYVNDPPSRPYLEEPDHGDFVNGSFKIIWGQVTDDENHNVRFNITLLNPDGTFNSTIVNNYGDINTLEYQWDTTLHLNGLYSMNITVYENETAEGLNTTDTLEGNFTIDNPEVTWESYNCTGRTSACQDDDFAAGDSYVYMNGSGFGTTGTYRVAYYDGGDAHGGVEGIKHETDVYTDDPDGILNESQYPFTAHPASYGTWHAVVYRDPNTPPVTYIADDANSVVEDSFNVQEGAIPEFPTVIAAIAVSLLCAVAYVVMRRKAGKR